MRALLVLLLALSIAGCASPQATPTVTPSASSLGSQGSSIRTSSGGGEPVSTDAFVFEQRFSLSSESVNRTFSVEGGGGSLALEWWTQNASGKITGALVAPSGSRTVLDFGGSDLAGHSSVASEVGGWSLQLHLDGFSGLVHVKAEPGA